MNTAGCTFPRSLALILTLITVLSGCTMGQVVVRGAMPLMEGGLTAMNREHDLDLARDAIPTTLMLLEGMLAEDPHNAELRLFAAQGFYGYSYAFIEADDPARAVTLYTRCLKHAQTALSATGFSTDIETAPLDTLQQALDNSSQKQVPGLFWAASCFAKRLDVDRTDPRAIAQLARAANVMERVLALDETYYHGGPHLFFGVYYGGRAPMFGGDFARSAAHFDKARAITQDRLLMADLLQAEYLARQQLDQQAFHAHLTKVVNAPDDLFPDMAFANRIAKQRARLLLGKEKEWF